MPRMTLQPEVPVPEIVSNLAEAVVQAQREMDAEWLDRVAEYRPVLDEAARLGFEGLARALAPTQVRVISAVAEAGLFVRQESSGNLRARLFSLAMLRRQSSVRSVNVRIRCEIRQSPLITGSARLETQNGQQQPE